MPKLYIEEFVGITNRLETLPLAFAIQKEYGHEIILDWRELDSFEVEGTRQGRVTWLTKLGAERVRNCDEAVFVGLRGKKILLRSLDGPPQRLDPIYMQIPSKLHLKQQLADDIRSTFAQVAERPVVGLHIRHGDFQVVDPESYSITGYEWPAVPIWWYEKTMEALVRKNKDICFFLSCTGDPDSHGALTKNFDVLTLPVGSHYGYKNDSNDHRSTVNPVADLFALACCPVVLATPISCYSHWAANVLGIPATCILPIPGATKDCPQAGKVNIFGSRLPRWHQVCRFGAEVTMMDNNFIDIELIHGADTSWL
ncbi:hypothetical protein [Trichlorobacter lovleyi]|uniref:hypothetical protein n=1 Tax=Trichlorobacter lovleyi TaxID=313985 RepID=UPI002480454E|nr:hypothetical protein [Trichlorobacter lovleyi]